MATLPLSDDYRLILLMNVFEKCLYRHYYAIYKQNIILFFDIPPGHTPIQHTRRINHNASKKRKKQKVSFQSIF